MKYTKYILTKEYIGQDTELTEMIETALKLHQVILFIAPQGTGKSYYIGELSTKGICSDVKIINPTTALSKQNRQTQIEAQKRDVFSFPDDVESHTFVSAGYQTDESETINKEILLHVDEPHKIVQYTTFAYEEQTQNALKSIQPYIDNNNPMILTTATPETLYCLEETDLYKSIGLCIEVEKEMDYLEQVNIWTAYSKDCLKQTLIKNQSEGLQIALINDTADIERLEKELNEAYNIKTIGITSKNRTKPDTEYFTQFQELVETGEINQYNILLATSWIDSGINFKSENITDLYCMLDNTYRMGDFTLIKQFLARARKSRPTLYIVAPKLSDEENRLINFAVKLSIEKENNPDNEIIEELRPGIEQELIQSIQPTNGEVKHQAIYDKLIDTLTEKNKGYIQDYHDGILSDSNLKNISGIVYADGTYKTSRIAMKYEIHRIIEKLECNSDLTTYIKNLTNCDNVHFVQPDKEQVNKNAVFHLCKPKEQQAIMDYLDSLVDNQKSFKQKEVAQALNTLSQGKITGKSLQTIFKNNDLPYKANRVRKSDYRLTKTS